jgi:hypothetical protein
MEEKKPKSLFESIKKIIILLYISIMILTTAGILSGWFFLKIKEKAFFSNYNARSKYLQRTMY